MIVMLLLQHFNDQTEMYLNSIHFQTKMSVIIMTKYTVIMAPQKKQH